ncbi:unnamed protein product [Candidula unifasciata]|uniref:BZIP domain-containing protein n=1 Tax=Candidula unifasciata TaxID=100452 RepID=A0A8S3YV98_9EUPU|nr:unnamed protein product [Candidula unifasciata]
MEFDTPVDVLDLLFDDASGLLKDDFIHMDTGINKHGYFGLTPTEHINGTYNINFGDLDLLSDNLFEDLIQAAEPNTFLDGESPDRSTAFLSDHDYLAHKSPSEHSDSGISVVSDESPSMLRLSTSSDKNATEDQLELYTSSESSLTCNGQVASLYDPSLTKVADSNFDYTNDEISDTFNEFGHTAKDDDISIDFDFDSLDSDFQSTQVHSQGTQSLLVLAESNKRVFSLQKTNKGDGTLPYTMKDVDPGVISCGNFPELHLSDEEKELLAREGVTLPTNLPLTRDEERVLKSVRRKIRNKISAKESRKRKQGYVEGLEQRVKVCTLENRDLQKKLDTLEKQNMSLMAQLKRLHSVFGKSKIPAQASTCAMVLMLSFALFLVPTFNPFGSSSENHSTVSSTNSPVRGKARNLLEHDGTGSTGNDDDDPYGVSPRPSSPWEVQTPVLALAGKKREVLRQDDASYVEPDIADLAKKISPVLAGDIQLDLASRVQDYTTGVNKNYTESVITDQNFADRNSEVAAES